MEMSRDAGSIPAASTLSQFVVFANWLFLWSYGNPIAINGLLAVHLALIAGLLIAVWVGRKPTKRTCEILCFYFLGVVELDELSEHIENRKTTGLIVSRAAARLGLPGRSLLRNRQPRCAILPPFTLERPPAPATFAIATRSPPLTVSLDTPLQTLRPIVK
jgi:hypothetical protein